MASEYVPAIKLPSNIRTNCTSSFPAIDEPILCTPSQPPNRINSSIVVLFGIFLRNDMCIFFTA